MEESKEQPEDQIIPSTKVKRIRGKKEVMTVPLTSNDRYSECNADEVEDLPE